MYNRYIPDEPFQPVEPERPREEERNRGGYAPGNSPSGGILSQLLSQLGLGGLFPGGKRSANGNENGSSGILSQLGLGKLDHGDLLLILVLIYLFRESEDEEWLIILGLVLLMGL